MKTILLTTALSILYAPAYACGNGECDPHPDEPEKPAPEKPQPEPEQPEPEKPAPEKPQPEQPAERPTFNHEGHDERVTLPRVRLAPITDQSYVPSEKWQPLPQVCERSWFTLRFSIPAGMTKAAARERCVEWLEGQ